MTLSNFICVPSALRVDGLCRVVEDNLGDHRLAIIDGRRLIEVEVRTLDDVIGRRQVDILKLDTQGSEASILNGSHRLLDRFELAVPQ